jgi:hypothetical protein
MTYFSSSAGGSSDQAAIFVDYGNLYSVLESQSSDRHHSSEFASEILDEVRRYLEEGDDTPTILSRAYADFSALPDGRGAKLQSLLYRDGVEPVMTPESIQGNTGELRLCLDVCSTLHERPDLQTIVIVTGDRPYLPLVRRIRESGRRALVAAVNPPHSRDGSDLADEDVYLDARNLLSQPSRDDLLANAPSSTAARKDRTDRQSAPPRQYRDITNPTARRTVEITEEYFGQYDEVYLTPLLRKLSDVLGEEHDPKSLVSELEAAGAVRLEKRDGYPYDYTVLIVNEDHPDVQEIQDDFYNQRSSYDGNGYSSYDTESDAEPDAGAEGAATDEDRRDEDPYDEDPYDEDEYGDAPDPSPTDVSSRGRETDPDPADEGEADEYAPSAEEDAVESDDEIDDWGETRG